MRWRALLLAGAFLALGALPAPAQPAGDSVIMALPTESMAFAIGDVAKALGLFGENGLKVKFVQIQGVGAINAVISGSADFAQASGQSLTRAAAHGQRLLAIFLTLDRLSIEIVLRKELAAGFDPQAPLAQRALALRGRTIALPGINTIDHGFLRLLAKSAGFDADEIHIAVLQPASGIAALATKQVDGLAMSPPWPRSALIDGSAVLIASGPNGDPADMWPMANTIVVTRPEVCAKRPQLCQGIGHALAKAADFYRDHPDETLVLLEKRFPTLDRKLVEAGFAEIRKSMPSFPAVTREGLEKAEFFNIEAGLMKPEEKLSSYDGLFTNAYVK